jgi:hypothetical protein
MATITKKTATTIAAEFNSLAVCEHLYWDASNKYRAGQITKEQMMQERRIALGVIKRAMIALRSIGITPVCYSQWREIMD